MPKIYVTDDAERIRVEVTTLPDPTAPDDEDETPLYVARCEIPRCWDSFVDENTIHIRLADAVADAETHLTTDHADATAA